MTKKLYTSPSVEYVQLTGMHCLCDSCPTPTPDISFGGGANDNSCNSGL